MPPLYERPLVMRTSMPSSSSSLATRSTFSSLALVKTFLIACSPLRRHVRGRLAGGDADQSFLRRAGDQLAFAVVDQPARQPARPLRAGAVDRVQQPVVGAERTVEQQRVDVRGHQPVRLETGRASWRERVWQYV